MKKGDLTFFYHSNEGTEIVGIAEIVEEAYQDPTTLENAWVAVDISPIKTLQKPVSLETIKKDGQLSQMVLVKNSRLSVQPVTKEEFEHILTLSKTKL